MAKIAKITTAEIGAIITETFANETDAQSGAEAESIDVKITEIKPDHINWRQVKEDE